jgi:hypothetical protein
MAAGGKKLRFYQHQLIIHNKICTYIYREMRVTTPPMGGRMPHSQISAEGHNTERWMKDLEIDFLKPFANKEQWRMGGYRP